MSVKMNSKIKIAVVGVEQSRRIVETLGALGSVSCFTCIQTLRGGAHQGAPDLVVLESGAIELEVPKLRSLGADLGWTFSLIAISRVDVGCDVLRTALAKGADDIFVAPVSDALLRVKVEHLMNQQARATAAPEPAPEIFDPERIEDLTMKEYRILRAIMGEPHMTISRHGLMRKVWPNLLISPKTVDVHLFNLRRKIRRYGYDIRSRLESGGEDGRCFELARVDRAIPRLGL
jgi:DNA-binding response OmpR family regulator